MPPLPVLLRLITVTDSDAASSLALLASVSAFEVGVPPSALHPPLGLQHDPMDVVEPVVANTAAELPSMPTPVPDVSLEARHSTSDPAPVCPTHLLHPDPPHQLSLYLPRCQPLHRQPPHRRLRLNLNLKLRIKRFRVGRISGIHWETIFDASVI
ncbi:hypothetical protein C8Q74DRAFT_1373476 [Fomes fomentarius]|nr:hypothetical protein C8Q74DRAFT_1373476 [Fomes fomentarius]